MVTTNPLAPSQAWIRLQSRRPIFPFSVILHKHPLSLANTNILDRTRTNSRHLLHLHLSTAQPRLHTHRCILGWSRSRNIFASLTLSVSLHTYSILQTGPGPGRGLLGSRFVLLLGWGLIRTANYTSHSAPLRPPYELTYTGIHLQSTRLWSGSSPPTNH